MRIETPLGPAWAAFDESGALSALGFREMAECSGVADSEVTRQIGEYFSGDRREFDLRLAPRGTAFQKRVWEELKRIPFGETISYSELARRVGRPGAARAVGRANATNPIALIIPCHRVIGSDGSLTGYAYGTAVKQSLIERERGVHSYRNASMGSSLEALSAGSSPAINPMISSTTVEVITANREI